MLSLDDHERIVEIITEVLEAETRLLDKLNDRVMELEARVGSIQRERAFPMAIAELDRRVGNLNTRLSGLEAAQLEDRIAILEEAHQKQEGI